MRIPIAFLAAGMLLTGTVNTIATKLQDRVVVGTDEEGNPLYFKHPALQTAMMFSGEMLCLLPFALRRWWNAERRAARPQEEKDEAAARQRTASWLFAVPALCDACGTTLLNLGLYYTYASVFQMLRGTLVLFAGFLTIVLLKRRLHMQHWLGMVLIAAGAALVGASSIIYDPAKGGSPSSGGPDHAALGAGPGGVLSALRRRLRSAVGQGGKACPGAPDPLLGDVLVVLAQLCTALQFIIEEKYLTRYQVPVLFAVGMEGAWGMALCGAAIPLLARTTGPDGLPLDSVAKAVAQIRASATLQWTTALVVLSIGMFNLCGVAVTKRLSGASRASIDACRTLLIWLFCLRAGWEQFHMLQVVGFVVLVSGTSIYNDLLRSCLPAPEPRRHVSHRRSARHAEGGAGDADAGGLQDPLLRGSPRAADGGGGDQAELGGSRRGVRFAEQGGHSSAPISAVPGGRGGGRGGAESPYTMARSVTILPAAFSPHSLASVPGASLPYYGSLGAQSYPSSAVLLDDVEEEGDESGTEEESGSELESDVESRAAPSRPSSRPQLRR